MNDEGDNVEKAYFELQWPRDNLFIRCFAHEIAQYRYHWHPQEYELNILLRGSQEFCYGAEITTLKEDDVILVAPGIGHASFAQRANTRALVLQFSSKAFKSYVKKGYMLDFTGCSSTEKNRNEERYRLIRFYVAQVFEAASQGGAYAQLKAKGSMELLLATLCCEFEPQSVKAVQEQDAQQQEVVRRLIAHMEQHYAEKITLEDLAQASQYNRTYVSTLFKNTVGVNFYEYLTRLRFQHALCDLASTEKNLTEIAIDNGFSDLKSFNKRFKETFHRTPIEYRAQMDPQLVVDDAQKRKFVSITDELVCEKLKGYGRLSPG